jgi:dihydropteroate synthase
VPVIATLAREGLVVSVDTRHVEVMRATIELARRWSTTSPRCARRAHEGRGLLRAAVSYACRRARTMQAALHYETSSPRSASPDDARMRSHWIARERIVIDPGFGFGKTLEHNLDPLRALPELRAGLSGAGRTLPRRRSARSPAGRPGTGWRRFVAALAAVARGAAIVRAHDVCETVDALEVWRAIEHGANNAGVATMTRQYFPAPTASAVGSATPSPRSSS